MEAWRSFSTWWDSSSILRPSKPQDFSPLISLSCFSAQMRRTIPSGRAGVERSGNKIGKKLTREFFTREDLVLSMGSGLRHHNWRMRYHTWSNHLSYKHLFVFISSK